MGFSVIISSGIIFTAFMILLYSLPGFLDPVFSIGDASKQSSQTINSILKTEISLKSLSASPGSPNINFTLNNDGDEKLWQFEDFDLFISYDSATGKISEPLSYGGFCQGGVSTTNSWCIDEIIWDLSDVGMLNKGEDAIIHSQVSQNLVTGIVVVVVSTHNGVQTSTSAAI